MSEPVIEFANDFRETTYTVTGARPMLTLYDRKQFHPEKVIVTSKSGVFQRLTVWGKKSLKSGVPGKMSGTFYYEKDEYLPADFRASVPQWVRDLASGAHPRL